MFQEQKYFLNWFSKLEFTYEDYFNKTTVMRDRPSYELFFDYGEPDYESNK